MSRRHAFTLIELLVVVAIIALLITILLPSLALAREQAKQTICASNQRQMGMAFNLYVEGNRDTFPAYRAPDNPWADNTGNARNAHWFERIRWYISYDKGVPDTFKCWLCPSSKISKYDANGLSYGYNYTHLGDAVLPVWTKTIDITEPARTIVTADSHDASNSSLLWDSVIAPRDYVNIYPVGPRHRGKANVLWADWHVGLEKAANLNKQRRLDRRSDYWWDANNKKRVAYYWEP
jgi:prepilin-type N-terminal cleavage/methylation domain-containing protein/prepilin-type processing-associated H-X9-DG protein